MRPLQINQSRLFGLRVRDCMDEPPPAVVAGSSCEDAVHTLRKHGSSMVVVTDGATRIAGIMTDHDVAHRMALRVPARTPVSELMTRAVQLVRADDYLFNAIATMHRHDLRHLPVIDRRGRLCGLLHLHRALAQAVPRFMDLVERLAHEESIAGFEQTKKAQIELVKMLAEEGVAYTEIQSLLTHINTDIHRRVVDHVLNAMHDEGWGPPPVSFDVIVMGSAGRGESFLFPDQDNGFVLADYPAEQHATVDAYFQALAEDMTQALDAVGFTLCRGHVMATNPLWRKSLSEWRHQISLWLRKPARSTLRLCDIFFDFRCVYGTGELTENLREHVTGSAPDRHLFLQEMQAVQEEHGVALGLMGRRLTPDGSAGPHKGKLNLKYHALLPLVEAVRLLALREGIPATSTRERIVVLHRRGVLDADEQDYLLAGFNQVTELVLRQQVRDFNAAKPVGAFVSRNELSEREKDHLIGHLQAINDLRNRIKSEFTAQVV